MRNLLFAIFCSILLAIGLIAVMNMQAQPSPIAGLLVEKTFIPSSKIQDMAYSSFEKAVQENKTALIFFYDNTCDVCIAQIAEIEALLEHFQKTDPKFLEDKFTYFEYDFYTGLRDKLNATNHHTLILIKEGKEVLRTREAMTKDELLEKIL
jgi:hypothetical protein